MHALFVIENVGKYLNFEFLYVQQISMFTTNILVVGSKRVYVTTRGILAIWLLKTCLVLDLRRNVLRLHRLFERLNLISTKCLSSIKLLNVIRGTFWQILFDIMSRFWPVTSFLTIWCYISLILQLERRFDFQRSSYFR